MLIYNSSHFFHNDITQYIPGGVSFCPSPFECAMAEGLALVKYWYIWYRKDITCSLSGMVVVTIMLGVKGQAMPSERAILNACQ